MKHEQELTKQEVLEGGPSQERAGMQKPMGLEAQGSRGAMRRRGPGQVTGGQYTWLKESEHCPTGLGNLEELKLRNNELLSAFNRI